MNVAIVVLSPEPPGYPGETGGDDEVGIDDLSAALTAAGSAVTVYTARADPALPDPLATVRAQFASRWFLARPDVVHTHSIEAGSLVAPVAGVCGIPLVQTFSGLRRMKGAIDRSGPAPASRHREEVVRVLRAAARIVATASAHVFELLELGAHPGAIKLVPAGVDLETFSPAVRSVGPSDARLRLVTLSALRPETGVGDVIAALAHVDDVELTIGELAHAGSSGGERSALEAVAEAHGVRDRIVFAGPIARSGIAPFLRAADMAVCAPWEDASGTFVVEAMACGIPVIASAVGKHLDAVSDGISGIQVAPRSPRQLAYAIDALRADAARRERYARFGLERARARYGWTRIGAELLDVYRGLTVAGGPARHPAEIV